MKKLGFLGFLLIMVGVIFMAGITGCDNGTTKNTVIE
jgi:hypothetical protein